MPINYISSADSIRYAQLYRLQELLRLDHNNKGLLYKTGQITKQEWEYYLENEFEKKEGLIIAELLKYRERIKKDTTINTALSDVIL
jgi:hypothetical protein